MRLDITAVPAKEEREAALRGSFIASVSDMLVTSSSCANASSEDGRFVSI